MNYSLLTSKMRTAHHVILAGFCTAAFVLFPGWSVSAQRPGERPKRDTVLELSRIDTNRAVELQIVSPNKTNAIRQAIQKQISDDFRDLQTLNNRMMADAWARSELDYKSISVTVGQIAKKAERLKSNLGLPPPKQEEEKKKSHTEISAAQDFRAELLSLDRSVMSFVTNPIFQKTSVVELKPANQASKDLQAVIDLSKRLKKVGEKFSKAPKDED